MDTIDKDVHLFALDDYRTLKKVVKFKFVTGIDSTVPFKCGAAGIKLHGQRADIKRASNYFALDKLTAAQEAAVKCNVKYFGGILNADRDSG